ncbi:MAG: N-formylglutamate amidohydrolase [Dongiaceae bacterium]
MNLAQHPRIAETSPYEIAAPASQTLPIVVASPHSGTDYSAEFLAASRLDRDRLRRSEDAFVDEIFARAPALGAPLLKANFPRAYVDPNREAFELDPAMFNDPLPAWANTRSPRVAAGLGTIPRVVASGEEIYGGKLCFAEATSRIDRFYRPYHAALTELVVETRERFGYCILIDGHSMPSVGGPGERDRGTRRTDIVIGDCFGTACANIVSTRARETLERLGYRCAYNDPYSGGFVTQHYGRPLDFVHVIQIEINRALYMDELAIRPTDNLGGLAMHMDDVVRALAAIDRSAFLP